MNNRGGNSGRNGNYPRSTGNQRRSGNSGNYNSSRQPSHSGNRSGGYNGGSRNSGNGGDFFSDLGSEIKRIAGIVAEFARNTFDEFKNDMAVFVASAKDFASDKKAQLLGDEGHETVRSSARGGEGRRPGTSRETVRSQRVEDSRAPQRAKSATGSRYDEDYSRGKKPTPTWWRVTKAALLFVLRALATILLICVMTGCIVGTTAMVYVLAYLDADIDFDLRELKLRETTKIYVLDDNNEYYEYQQLHGSENREWVDLEQIPKHAQLAAVAIEDKRFYTHHGVDWRRTVWSFANLFLHMTDDTQGGSTITQQLIKNITDEKEVSIERKLKEIFRALNLEKEYSKDEILESYLNVIALGNGCNGIQSAAQTYFDKDVSELTLAEAACIVGITKNPSKYNPLYRPENNKERQEDVLSKMLEQGYITQEEHDAAVAEELVFNESAKYNPEITSYNNWYVDQIIYDLLDEFQNVLGYSKTNANYEIYNGGLDIYACMDPDLQEKVESIFAKSSNFKKFPKKVQPQCALAVMTYDGQVKAIVGGRGTKSQDLVQNHASQSQRQPGSSFKPVSAYGPAVALGILEYSTPVTDQPITLNGKKWPKNSGGVYRGNIPVVKGVEVSANCVAVRVARVLGYETSYEFMTKRLGLGLVYNKKINGKTYSDTNPSTCLGSLTVGVTALEMTAAYATFGNGGKYYEPYTYTKVVQRSTGDVLLEHDENDYSTAMSVEAATIMNRILRSPITGSSGTARTARIGSHPVFGKTGTTSDDYDRYFAGGTPYYVCASWFGYEIPAELEIKSPNHALSAWKLVMQAAHKGLKVKNFSWFSKKVVARKYCTVSGGLAGPGCGSTATGYYATNSTMPLCPLHSGGVANEAFTRYLEDKAAFGTGESLSSTDESMITTESTSITTLPPEITTAPTTEPTTVTTEPTTTTATTPAPTDPPTSPPTDPPTSPPTDPPTSPPTDPPTAAPTTAPTAAPTEPPAVQEEPAA